MVPLTLPYAFSCKKLNNILPPSDRWKLTLLLILLLIASVLEVAGIGIILTFVSIVTSPERIQDVPFLPSILEWFDIKTQRDLLITVGWEPEISLEQSLRDALGWWREKESSNNT